MCVSVSCDPVSTPPSARSGVPARPPPRESFGPQRSCRSTGARYGPQCRRQDRLSDAASTYSARTRVETFDTLHGWPRPQSRPRLRRTRRCRRRSPRSPHRPGVSVPTVSKVINGRADVAPETRRRVEAAIRDAGYQRPPGTARRAPLIEVIFHELESEWALEIVRGVERVAGQHQLARRPVGDAGPPDARPRLDRGRPGPATDRRHRRLLRPDRHDARPAPVTRDPARRRRPDRRAAARHPFGRGHELERRLDGDPPPARPRTPPDRRHRWAGSGSCAAVPGSTAIERRWTRPACPSIRGW